MATSIIKPSSIMSRLSASTLLQLDEGASSSGEDSTSMRNSASSANPAPSTSDHQPKQVLKHNKLSLTSSSSSMSKKRKAEASPPPTGVIDLANDSDTTEQKAHHDTNTRKSAKMPRTEAASPIFPASSLAPSHIARMSPNGTQHSSSGPIAVRLDSPLVAASRSNTNSMNGEDDEVDLEGLGRELGVDLSAPATPAPRSLGFESMVGEGEGGDSNKKKSDKKAARRYFDGEDITTKCYNCNQVGHISTECTSAKVFKPCFICGLRGHAAFRCPREMCFRCQKAGHQSKDCKNPRAIIKICFWCGSTTHSHEECTPKLAGANSSQLDLSHVRCMVCGNQGHLNCAIGGLSVAAITVGSCSNCGQSGHLSTACEEERMETHVNVDNYGNVWSGEGPPPAGGRLSRNRDWKADVECFYCGNKGHLKMDCPKKMEDDVRYARRRSSGGGFTAIGSNGVVRSRGVVNQDRRYNQYNERRSSFGSASPFSRASGRERDRDRDRDRDFLNDRSHDRRGARNQHQKGTHGRSSNDNKSKSHRSKSAPPAKRR